MNSLSLSTPLSTGGAGVSTATVDSNIPVHGQIFGVQIKYNGSPPAGTTDVTVKTKGSNGPTYNVLKVSNAATDGMFFPVKNAVDTAGAVVAGVYWPMPVADWITVLLEGANDGDSVDVTIFFE